MSPSSPGHRSPQEVCDVVEEQLRAAPEGSTVRDLVDRTALSSLILIPALDRLVADGHVHRVAGTGTDGHRFWTYRLTARRRRQLTGTRAAEPYAP